MLEKGMDEKVNINDRSAYYERLVEEIEVIQHLDLVNYFLIVSDIIAFAKENDIMVGVGRGSAGGSLVCYLLGITKMDPVKYGLLFSRFLNKDRVSVADIDLDFEDTRRDEIIDYIFKKYGEDHVVHIGSFGTNQIKGAIKDVARTKGMNFERINEITKSIYIDPVKSDAENLQEAFAKTDLWTDSDFQDTMNTALKISGFPRNSSVHPSGILICRPSLTECVPLKVSNDTIASQIDMDRIEQLGLLKIDVLGVRSLTVVHDTLKQIKKRTGKDIDIFKIPVNDYKTFQSYNALKTLGIFMFESNGMKNTLRKIRPKNIEHLTIANALFRPGSMSYIDDYAAFKNGRSEPVYLHPSMEKVLESTYGILVYQEQVIELGKVMAGFTSAEADVLRHAVGKKKIKEMAEQKEKFISGCANNNISQDVAEKVFSWFEEHAKYSFNRSHALAYALNSYCMMWLKTHYPTEFFASLITNAIRSGDQKSIINIPLYIREATEDFHINVMPPSVNEPCLNLELSQNGISMGLLSIKTVGGRIAKKIIAHGKYNDLYELYFDKDINIGVLKNLIKSGACDCLIGSSWYRKDALNFLSDMGQYVVDYEKWKMQVVGELRKEYRESIKGAKKYNKEEFEQWLGQKEAKTSMSDFKPMPVLSEDHHTLKGEMIEFELETIGFVLFNPLKESVVMETNKKLWVLVDAQKMTISDMMGIVSTIIQGKFAGKNRVVIVKKNGEDRANWVTEELSVSVDGEKDILSKVLRSFQCVENVAIN